MATHQSQQSASRSQTDDASSGKSSLRSAERGDLSSAGDEEKKIGGGLLGDRLGLSPESREIEVEPVTRCSTVTSSRPRLSKTHTNVRSVRSIRSHHSRAGADGYTLNHAEEKPNNSSGATGDDTADLYLVRWEGGDADPMNPRSMTRLRRWCILFIVSASSLCV